MSAATVFSHHPHPGLAATSRIGCPVSYDVSPAGIALANTLDAFVAFLQELSGCGDAYPEYTFTAACRNHADAVVMPSGGPWPAPMVAAWDCVEPVEGSDWR